MMAKFPVYGISDFLDKEHEAFYSNDLRQHLASHQFINHPHKHNTYIAVLFTKGKGEHQIDYKTYPVKAGSVFLLNPGQVHCWNLSKDVDGYVFFHNKDFYDSLFIHRKINDFPFFYLEHNDPVIYLSPKERTIMASKFKEINEEVQHKRPMMQAVLGSLVDLVYLSLSRLYLNNQDMAQENPSGYVKVRTLQRLIDEHFIEKKLPKQYADMMNMSARHLGRLCRELLNKSTTDLIAERIIIEAKRLLIHSDTPISVVAEQLGFDDYSYFVRFFKKQVGVAPKQFQKTEVNWKI